MSWSELHARIEVMHEVLTRAATDPNDPNLFTGIPELDPLFGGIEGLLLALRSRWKIHLEAKLEDAAERGELFSSAYAELRAEQPALYQILQKYLRETVGLTMPLPAAPMLVGSRGSGATSHRAR
ncbi:MULTISPECIES: hypothetical protein [Nocardia]|uniref:hypothetical protein n=1 Tax=Nocardia TaxID=1817 RepID=UPI000A4B96E1|nr:MULTISPECIES: hypothetical protein [Nocardia]MBF6278729.1 hypothetical protein [Nocardia nova]